MDKQLKEYLPFLKECIGDKEKCMNTLEQRSIFYIPMSETLDEFIQTFYSLDILNTHYIEYLEERGLNTLEDIAEQLDSLSLEELYAVLTQYIRSDRFITGRLISLAHSGLLYETVKRIVDLQ